MLDQMLMDRFRIVKQIGFGAFGETFLADDTHKRLSNQSSSQCVVKRLITQTDPAHIAITRQMFEREASKLDDLNHSGIPKLIAYFEDNGQFYLVQEFIDGHPLSDEINHTVKWSESRTRGLLREVLEILAYVHSHGSIHRDLKPSNIMRRRANDKIVLIDFGAVREVQQNQTNVAVGLASGTIAIGTLGYMPAEQTQGRPCFASDIYAVGCMAIEALTAEAPYGYGFEQDAETGEFRWRHKAQVSDDFVEYIDKMVRYDFRQRFRNAEQALTALQSLKPMAPPPTTIIVTQPDAALPSPNESKTVEPTQVTTPQPDLSSTELLVSPPDSASSSTIVTVSEPKSESTASTIVTSPDVQHEASHVELEQAVESTQIIESKQQEQSPTKSIPSLSELPVIPTGENESLPIEIEAVKPLSSNQLTEPISFSNLVRYGLGSRTGSSKQSIAELEQSLKQNQSDESISFSNLVRYGFDSQTKIEQKTPVPLKPSSFTQTRNNLLIVIGLIGLAMLSLNVIANSRFQSSSSTYTPQTPTSTPTPTPTNTPNNSTDSQSTPQSKSNSSTDSWKEYTSSSGKFRIQLPSKPTEQSQDQKTDVGTIKLNMVIAEANDSGYFVGYADFPNKIDNPADIQKSLAGSIKGSVSNLKGEILSEREYSLGTIPCRDFVASGKVQTSNVLMSGRYCLAENRLYQVFVLGANDKISTADVSRFIESFKIES
jgi:serine/threonine protein kinase